MLSKKERELLKDENILVRNPRLTSLLQYNAVSGGTSDVSKLILTKQGRLDRLSVANPCLKVWIWTLELKHSSIVAIIEMGAVGSSYFTVSCISLNPKSSV